MFPRPPCKTHQHSSSSLVPQQHSSSHWAGPWGAGDGARLTAMGASAASVDSTGGGGGGESSEHQLATDLLLHASRWGWRWREVWGGTGGPHNPHRSDLKLLVSRNNIGTWDANGISQVSPESRAPSAPLRRASAARVPRPCRGAQVRRPSRRPLCGWEAGARTTGGREG